MNSFSFFRRAALAALLVLPVALTACDFSAIENPVDDFDLIIELPPIETVVNGQIVDAATQQPIQGNVTIAFAGDAGSRIIDAYSDPVQRLEVKNGVVSFGIDNALVPTEASPVRFTVVAKADGYFANEQEVVLTETGSSDFAVSLLQKNAGHHVEGTSGTETQAGTTSGSGVAEEVTVATPASQARARAAVTMAQGTVPTTRSAQALQGQLTVTLRVFDPNEGLAALPQAAKRNASGKGLAIAGAAFFKVVDAGGRVAATFEGGSAFRAAGAGKTAATCTGGVQVNLTVTDANLVAAYHLLKQSDPDGVVRAAIWGYTPADQQNRRVGETVLEAGASADEVAATICIGGSTPTVDVSLLGDVADGVIYSVALAGGQIEECDITAGILGTNPNATAVDITRFALVGPGVNIQRTAPITAAPGAFNLALAAVLGQSRMARVVGAAYQATAYVQGQPSSVTIANPCAPAPNAHPMTLPTVSNLETYTINASLTCPVGQKFDVQLTAQSVDALSVSYKVRDSNEPYAFIRNRNIARTVTASSITASTQLALRPGTAYRLFAVYGTGSTTQDIVTPASGGPIDLAFNPADAGLTCKTK